MPGPIIENFGRDLRELGDYEDLNPSGLTGEEILALFSAPGAQGRRIIGKISTQRLADLLLAIGVFTSLSVEDDAYAAGWNGSLHVPTKNALYDKIEAAIAALQPLDTDLTAIAALTTTALGRSVLAAATAAAIATIAGVGTGDSPTHVALTLSNGQIVFPASQVASAGANTLDDYEEGTFTPAFTFASPSNVAFTWSVQIGQYTKIGRQVSCQYELLSSAYTLGTATGNALLTGFPFAANATANSHAVGVLDFQGITKANYTQFVTALGASANTASITGDAQAQSASSVTHADVPSGGTLRFIGSLTYFT